jgi:hypothetical protein
LGKCPDCMKEYREYKKKWKYGPFEVEAFSCECGTDFREYRKSGKHSFTLKKAKNEKKRARRMLNANLNMLVKSSIKIITETGFFNNFLSPDNM